MNNILPRVVKMHLKYDLKGSTYKRRASKKEKEKSSPTYKDLDFMQDMPEGIMLDTDTFSAVVKTLQRDCLVGLSSQCGPCSVSPALLHLYWGNGGGPQTSPPDPSQFSHVVATKSSKGGPST